MVKETKMNKSQLIDAVSKKTNLSRTHIKCIVKTILTIIVDTLKDGKSVQLAGFGTFKVNSRAARIGRNPQTGETIQISEKKIPTFTSGKSFKTEIEKTL
ncbi:HU family DNA-binding protein [Buchnera aphidicola]|nr:HU family DNA-binding protein [Buchnera aphidicola]